MENLWEMIAKARGVKLGADFIWTLNGKGDKCKITLEEGLLVYDNYVNAFISGSMCCNEFITGEGEIEKLPFRPKRVEVYYTIIHNTATVSYHWADTTADYERLIAGLVFRTKEEAEAYIPTWKERISKL